MAIEEKYSIRDLRVKKVPNLTAGTIKDFIKENIVVKNTRFSTDESIVIEAVIKERL